MNPPREAALFFLPGHAVAAIVPFGSGNINDTFEVTLHSGEQRILQRLNPDVFPDPERVMRNIRMVLDHLAKQVQGEAGRQDGFIPLTLYEGRTGPWYLDGDGAVWRLTGRIRDCRTRPSVATANQARELGRGLGFFHRMLGSLDAGKLADTLPGFHNTPAYLRKFDEISSSREPDSPESESCCRFIEQKRSIAGLLEDNRNRFRRGIIHGDPKVSNFLFDLAGERVISLIDLDTVGPGLLLYDLGDAVRSCCNPAGETAQGKTGVLFDAAFFQAWLQGYFSRAGSLLNHEDRDHIVAAALVITFELGIRFFSDYLAGNKYFKTEYPEQNLHRAMVQFSLVRSIEQQQGSLESMVQNLDRTR